mgnify:FL=1
MNTKSKKYCTGSEIAYDISKVFWIITIILALIYFGFVMKGIILAIVGEISLIVAVFACLCCWISLSKKEEEKKIKIYPLQVKIHPVTRTQYIV